MGTLQQDYLIIPCDDYDKELISFMDKIKCNLITKTQGWANGEMTYFMAWDGSKEGWNTSDKADSVRNELIEYLELHNHNYYRVRDGDFYEEPTLTTLEGNEKA